MKGFIFLMLISLINFSYAGDLTQGGGGGTKEPTIRGRMVLDKSDGFGIEKPVVEIKANEESREIKFKFPIKF